MAIGRSRTVRAHLAQRGDASVAARWPPVCARRARRASTWVPKNPSSAGSSVNAEITVSRTVMLAAIATP